MSVCNGTLWIVDRSCLMYTRLWCLYEAYKSMNFVRNDREYKFDVYTPVDDKDSDGTSYGAVGITDGYIPSDHGTSLLKTERESKFPLDRVLKIIMELDIKKSLITVEQDRKFILNSIAGQSIEEVREDGNEVKELEICKRLPTESIDISIGKIISEYLSVKLPLVFCSSDTGV